MSDKTAAGVLAEFDRIDNKVRTVQRAILYTDTIGGAQTLRDDLWAISTKEVEEIRHIISSALKQAVEAVVVDGKLSLDLKPNDNPIYHSVETHGIGWNAARTEMLRRMEQFFGEGLPEQQRGV